MEIDDPVIASLPIRLSTLLDSRVQLHQFPLTNRPLEVPPSAEIAGKKISARVKPGVDKLEIHVPFDTREDVWNKEKGQAYGQGRAEEDGKKPSKSSSKDDRRLEELRLASERVPNQAAYMVGIVRDNQLYLHPVTSVYRFRPNLGYLDAASAKGRRRRGGEEEFSDPEGEDNGEDEEKPTTPKKKAPGEAKEIHVSARKAADAKFPSGMSDMRRELLRNLKAEEEEEWQKIKYHPEGYSEAYLEKLISKSDTTLECTSTMASILESF